MKKYDLMKSGEKMIRVLEVQEDKVLIIDCVRKTMPEWVDTATLDAYEGYFSESISELDALTAEQKKVMQERYTMFAPVLAVLGDKKKRSMVIASIAETYGVSKQTVRKYLCQYLSAMDITVLAPKSKADDPPLTKG